MRAPAHSERTDSTLRGAEAFPPSACTNFRGGLTCTRDCQFSPFLLANNNRPFFFVSKSPDILARARDWCPCGFRRVQNGTRSRRRCPLASTLLLCSSHFGQLLSQSALAPIWPAHPLDWWVHSARYPGQFIGDYMKPGPYCQFCCPSSHCGAPP